MKIQRRGYIEYRLYMINDRLWDFYNHFSWRFPRILKFFNIFAPSALDYLNIFSFAVNQKNDIQTLFWWPFPAVLDPTVRKESFGLKCSYILEIVDTFLSSNFVFIHRLSLLSLSLYYRTELVSNGKNVCCSSIQSQRNWICIVSYPRQRNSFLTVRSVQESLGSINSASTTLASEDRIWEISESSKNAITEQSCEKRKTGSNGA